MWASQNSSSTSPTKKWQSQKICQVPVTLTCWDAGSMEVSCNSKRLERPKDWLSKRRALRVPSWAAANALPAPDSLNSLNSQPPPCSRDSNDSPTWNDALCISYILLLLQSYGTRPHPNRMAQLSIVVLRLHISSCDWEPGQGHCCQLLFPHLSHVDLFLTDGLMAWHVDDFETFENNIRSQGFTASRPCLDGACTQQPIDLKLIKLIKLITK